VPGPPGRRPRGLLAARLAVAAVALAFCLYARPLDDRPGRDVLLVVTKLPLIMASDRLV
jgi:hypothetical protein